MHRGHEIGVLLDHVRKLPASMTTFAKADFPSDAWLALEAIVAGTDSSQQPLPTTPPEISVAPSGSAGEHRQQFAGQAPENTRDLFCTLGVCW